MHYIAKCSATKQALLNTTDAEVAKEVLNVLQFSVQVWEF